MASTSDSCNGRANSPRPFFVPSDINFDDLSEELKAAIGGVIDPAYRQLVVEAGDELARSVGVTIVHLLWLEIIDQFELAEELDHALRPSATDKRQKLIERHLRLVNAKSKAGNFLLRLREFRRKFGGDLAQPAPTPETIEPPGGWPRSQSGD